jgi:hypothetical protein
MYRENGASRFERITAPVGVAIGSLLGVLIVVLFVLHASVF